MCLHTCHIPPDSLFSTQVEAKGLLLKRCDILIATPGRLIDHLETGNLKPKLQQVQNLILDEADRLLEQGFARELDKILSHLPDKKQVPRQTMLFSATMSQEVKKVSHFVMLCFGNLLIVFLDRSSEKL